MQQHRHPQPPTTAIGLPGSPPPSQSSPAPNVSAHALRGRRSRPLRLRAAACAVFAALLLPTYATAVELASNTCYVNGNKSVRCVTRAKDYVWPSNWYRVDLDATSPMNLLFAVRIRDRKNELLSETVTNCGTGVKVRYCELSFKTPPNTRSIAVESVSGESDAVRTTVRVSIHKLE